MSNEESGVTVNALHPGNVKTNILAKDGQNLLASFIGFIGQFFFVTPEQGAETSVYLATSDEVAGISGKYFANKREKTPHKSSLDPQKWARLWTQTEAWVSKGQI